MSQNVYIGMTLKPWPILLDHYINKDISFTTDKELTVHGSLIREKYRLDLGSAHTDFFHLVYCIKIEILRN